MNTTGNASDTFVDGICDTSATAGSQCTLRGAIQEANGNPGTDTINFNLPSPYKITLTSSGLPPITSPVLIDGTSLPGFTQSGGTIIRIDGVSASTGVQYDLDVQPGGDGTTIKGLEVERAGIAGIRLAANNNTVTGSNIGSTWNNLVNCAAGSSCSNNVGVLIQDGSNNTIGGTIPFNRNVISNNASYGVELTTIATSAANNVIQGNYIGTLYDGTGALPNGYGVVISDQGGPALTGTVIGGTTAGAQNVISGNSNNGIDANYGSMTIAGNYVGLNAAGTAAVPNNGTAGIYLYGATTSATIGGSATASKNVISGNGQEGVEISGPTQPMTIQNNYIGTKPTGDAAIPNGYDGVYAYNTDDLTVSSNVLSGNNVFGGEELRLDYGSDALISGNTIGLALDGSTALGDPGTGISLNASIGTTVDANTIANHVSYGVYANATDSIVVTNNKIGTDASGMLDRGNGQGIYLGSSTDATIGKPGAGNIISGNDAYGIQAASSSDSSIQGNLIGTDATGATALANGATGIWLSGSARVAVGGTAAGSGNVIVASGVGCCEAGIYLSGADDNTILGNRVGVGTTGGSLPNNWVGVYLDSGSDTNQIGSTSTGGGNIIANNADAGVVVGASGLRNQIRGNSIHDNALLGIDLGQDGVTSNDIGDPDFGANRLQNYPVLTTSASSAAGTQVSGTLNSKPNKQYALDFYANSSCDPSGNGEGETYLGSSTVTTNGAGNVSFQATLSAVAATGSQITATATDAALGDTSEFSACLANQGGLPSVSVANTSAAENAGNMGFTVTLSSAPVFTPVTVNYTTADGTATSPADYTASSGTVTFNAGETTKNVNVPIVNDALDENNETFTLTLSNPTNAVLASGQSTATGTINDDDAAPTVNMTNTGSSPTVTEPDAGSVNETFTVGLSAASALPVTVVVHTVSGTATEGVDFTANAAQLTFDPGQTAKTFTVAVLGDTTDEFDEKYSAQLVSPTNAVIGTGSRNGTIADNDAPPNVSINDVTGPEGNSGKKGFLFTVSLSAPSAKTVRVSIPTPANGTAVAPGDYAVHSPVLLNFAPGSTSIGYVVQVKGDTTVESDETFFVNLDPGTTVNGTIVDGTGIGTIQNDD